MDLKLTISVPGQKPATQLLVTGTTYTLGRSTDCDIVIPSPYVSRTPIRVEWTGLGFDVVDTANRNPIVINGYPLAGRRQLNPGDLVTIGDVSIAVEPAIEEPPEPIDPNATMMPGVPAQGGQGAPSTATVMPPPATPAPPAVQAAPPPQQQAPTAATPAAPPAQPAPAPPPTPAAPAAPAASAPPTAAAAAAAPAPPAGATPAAPYVPPRPAGTDYGTLRVRHADGGITEYSIEARTVVVGRASGVGITIEDDVSVDRRHFQLKIEDGQVTIEDLGSAGGTFLGGQRLQPNTIHRLAERQVIRFGNCEAELLPPGPKTGTKERPPTISVSLAPPPQPIAAGGTSTATITIHNRGRVVDQVSLRVPDIDPAWVDIRRPTVPLAPGARDEVTIVFKPPKTPQAVAGEHPFAVSVISAESGSEVRALGRFTVLPFEMFDFACRPRGKRGRFNIVARNGGNCPSAYALSANDEAETLKYQFASELVELAPGEEKSIDLRVRPKRRNPFGQPKTYRFAVEARPEGSAVTRATASGTYSYRPRLSRWRLYIFPVLAVLGLGTLMGFARGNPSTIINWFRSESERPRATATVAPTTASGGDPTVTTAPATATTPAVDCSSLNAGCEAVVINSPSDNCLRLRSAPSSSGNILSRLCDGTQLSIIGGPSEAQGFRWWEVQLEDGTRGFVAERNLSGSGNPRDYGPWLEVVN